MLPSILKKLLCLCVITLLAGCSGIQSQRVVLIPPVVWVDGKPTDVLTIGPGGSGRVYVRTKEGQELSQNVIQFPEGWLLIPPPSTEVSK